MSAINEEQRPRLVAVVGGTGTLGRHLVDRLTGHGIRVSDPGTRPGASQES